MADDELAISLSILNVLLINYKRDIFSLRNWSDAFFKYSIERTPSK